MAVNEALNQDAIDATQLLGDLRRHIGRFAAKQPDWDAFPANNGYPDLARAQIRYVGAGGSPKVSDPSTIKADHFTLSLVYLPVGKYAASHVHPVEEAFFVVQGVLTVATEYDGKIVRSRLAARDMLLNEPARPHGFLNEGFEPVLMAIMVGNVRDKPVGIRYKFHPKDVDAELAQRFGGVDSQERYDVDQWIMRRAQAKPRCDATGVSRITYIGEGGAPAGRFRKELAHVPQGRSIPAGSRNVEEVYFVLSGYLTVGWDVDGTIAEERLGPRDAVFNPAGRLHYFRNDGIDDVELLLISGNETPVAPRLAA